MRFTILIAAFLTTLAAALPTAEPAAEPVPAKAARLQRPLFEI
jgi:hypothetical protein